MKKNIIKVVIGLFVVATLMFGEYRFIMNNIHPYMSNHNTIYIEVFGVIDEYTYS